MQQQEGLAGQSSAWVLFVIALVLRLTFVLAYEQYPPFLADDARYDGVAWNMAQGRGFVSAEENQAAGVVFEPVVGFGPMYPAFLALIYFLFGHSIVVVRVIQAFVGAVTVVLVVRVANAVFGKRIAFTAGALTSIHPALIVYTGMLLTETLFAFLLMLSLWTVIIAVQSRSVYAWLRAGIVSGFAVLLREEAVVIFFLSLGALVWYGEGPHKTRHLLIFCAALVVTVGLWSARNYLVFHKVITVSAYGGPALWISTMGWSEWRYDDEVYKSLARQGANLVEQNQVFRREAVKNILDDPLRYLRLCLERIPPFWLGSHTTYLAGFSESFQAYYVRDALHKLVAKVGLLCMNIGLLALALWGIWVSAFKESMRRHLHLLVLCPIMGIAAVHFFLFATSRYQVPIIPFLMIFAPMGMIDLFDRYRKDKNLLALR